MNVGAAQKMRKFFRGEKRQETREIGKLLLPQNSDFVETRGTLAMTDEYVDRVRGEKLGTESKIC